MNLAISLSELGLHEKALALLLPFAESGDAGPDILYNAALCSQNLKKYPQAKTLYEQVLTIVPGSPEALINLGLVHRSLNDIDAAMHCFLKVLEKEPAHIDALYNYASVLIEAKQFDAAEKLLHEVLTVQPVFKEATNDLGQIFFQRMRFDAARELFSKCVEIAPEWWHGLFNLALTLHEQGQYQKAIAGFRDALLLEPENPLIHFGLAESLLSVGEIESGLKHYEYRVHLDTNISRNFSIPRWHGENLSGKKIYIYEEQGSGDTFQFIRLLHILKQQGAEIVFECKPAHERLFGANPHIDTLLTGPDEQIMSACNFFSPLLSLPLYLKHFADAGRTTFPYIHSPVLPTGKMLITADNVNNKKVGLVWSGNTFSNINKKRHCLLSALQPLFSIPGLAFFSLQVDAAKDELAGSPFAGKITDLSPYITDFADTASIIAELDCVVSIDTSVAHLAAAMGKPVYLLLAKVPDWRWQGKEDTCDWYPTMKLFRQQEQGNWETPVKALANELNPVKPMVFTPENPLVLALTSGENFGWGVCSKYIVKHLSATTPVSVLGAVDIPGLDQRTIFHAIQNNKLEPLHSVRGKVNIGYTFFEFLLDSDSTRNAGWYDLILGGSTWNKEKLIVHGIKNAEVLLQGVDPEIFYPIEEQKLSNLFVIFSGGKFELRKGQDMVLKAVGILQQRYKDVILINAWYNMWPQTMMDMAKSQYIKFDVRGSQWTEVMEYLYLINGLDRDRIFTLELTKNSQLRGIYAKSDIGLFPNRCEGGTNLVLMEYMACAKPVIASYNTGHKDVLTEDTSYLLKEMKPFEVYDNGVLAAEWEEPSLDEIVAKLDYAYHHRDEIKNTGHKAGEYMKNFTWEKTAQQVLRYARAAGSP
ncbi:MAG: tetratricopeptide repeat protein [Ignavibacteriales bacterium]|nr:tetratricopeptide repeat protein [Ignavibacteriales bacterium]